MYPCKGGSGVHKKWVCICPVCHQEFVTQSNHLIGDKIQSCSKCSRKKHEDLTGRRFWNLTVLERVNQNGNMVYLCKCDCGNNHYATPGHLKSGTVRSCGCLKSSYEQTIQRILEENNIRFETEKVFQDCRAQYSLRFDFFIPELNTLIEMQGEQHFKAVKFWDGEEGFQKRLERDRIKEEYCAQNGYNLVKIVYNEDIEQRVNEEIVWPLRK